MNTFKTINVINGSNLQPFQAVLTSFFTVVVRCVKLGIVIRKLNTSNNEMVLFVRGVRPQNQPVHTVVFPLRPVMTHTGYSVI